VATDFLIHYQGYDLQRTWILNHIFFHELKAHTRTTFVFKKRLGSWRKHRAFDDSWRRSPRPLFTLLERARADEIVKYATDALKTDFRAALREVEPAWVARLIGARNPTIDVFAIWILDNVPRFEQSKFHELGLHDEVLQLFNSQSPQAQKYAANYARTHARDLPVTQLISLANNHNPEVRKLAVDLLRSRDPRKEIGLDAWGELLATEHGYKIAADALRKNFGGNELTREWFVQLIVSADDNARQFAADNLTRLHPRKQLGWSYFVDILEQLDYCEWTHQESAQFCCDELDKLQFDEIEQGRLQRLMLHPVAHQTVMNNVDEGKLKASALGATFLKVIAFQPTYEENPLIAQLKQTVWGKHHLDFDEGRAEIALTWLADVRQFSPDDLGFEWLLQLVQRSEPIYHDFAVQTLTKSFLPADFAADVTTGSEPPESASDAETKVDLGAETFLFTGKLATMSRGEAQTKVTTAGGANSTSVTKKLDYLVIGDEGSPLYGQGRKGSKQNKAEKLNEQEAGIHIISETAFCKCLPVNNVSFPLMRFKLVVNSYGR